MLGQVEQEVVSADMLRACTASTAVTLPRAWLLRCPPVKRSWRSEGMASLIHGNLGAVTPIVLMGVDLHAASARGAEGQS